MCHVHLATSTCACKTPPLPTSHAPTLVLRAQVYQESDLSAHVCNLASGRQENPRQFQALAPGASAAAAEGRTVGPRGCTVGPQGQSWRLLPTRSGRPGSGGGSAAGLRAMTSALVWCSVQSPLVGVARDTPSPERNKTGRGPGAPNRRLRRAFPPARRAASCQVSAPRGRASPAPTAPPARRATPVAPARLPRPPGSAGAQRGARRKSGAARRPSRGCGSRISGRT